MSWRKTNWCNHNEKDKNTLSNSIKEHYNIFGDPEFFHPILTLFIRSNMCKKRLNNRYQVNKLIKKINYIDRNVKLLKAQVYDLKTKKNVNKLTIVKESPLVPIHFYQLYEKQLQLGSQLVNTYDNYLFVQNFNCINNSAYVEILITYLTSNLYENKITPHFPLFYGTAATKLKKFTFKYKDNKYALPQYNCKIIYKKKKKLLEVSNFPVQLIFFEKINFSLYDLVENVKYNKDIWMSLVFQVSAALNILQNRYNICHNDLHVGNVMYSDTKIKYIYYQHPIYDNKVFKIPTYGKIYKIIDWGRGTLKYKDKFIFNNVFYTLNSADGQYFVNEYNDSKKKLVEPNTSIDINFFIFTLFKETRCLVDDDFTNYLEAMCIDKDGETIIDDENTTFKDYINISHNCNFFTPKKLIESRLYKVFIENKIKDKHLYYIE